MNPIANPSGRAEFYLCLSRAFAAPTGSGDLALLREELPADLQELAAECGYNLADALADYRAAIATVPDGESLLVTYSRLFLVPGDRLPEVHASLQRRVSPRIVARVSSNYAAGGGGGFLALNRRAYENDVALLSTSLDTTFERTSTGVYLAFHRLEQRLEPVRNPALGRRALPAEVAFERLELVLSQDLAPLFDLASDWALQLGMEVSRGATLFQEDAENRGILRHRLLTGVAVRF